ncbi:MAG: ABC transporter ATP-binding protein [Actinobacteria bacterium]|nr:ABC transporter ATP-binding protein [Actinomycetota bacterium]
MLKLSNLSVNYGVVRALNDVSFEVPEGHITALLGSNGAGKTSLLRAVSGLVPYLGSITFDGTEASKLGPEHLARAGVLQVPEGRRIVADLTVVENLKLGLTALGGRVSKVDIDGVFEIFPALAGMKEREGWMLSGGEQQMLAIGRALVTAPRLLLLDEPSLGLAPVIIKAVYEALATVLKGTTVLLVEQSTANALSLCNEAVVLAQGNVSAKGAPSIFTRDFLAKAYLGG